MSKQDFIALADYLRTEGLDWTPAQLDLLARFCKSRNPRFLRERWLGYIAGTNGPNGGAIKPPRPTPSVLTLEDVLCETCGDLRSRCTGETHEGQS